MAQIVGSGLLADFASMAVDEGVSTADEKIVPEVRTKCAQAKIPILTRAQVTELIAIASPGDASALQQVTIFGPKWTGFCPDDVAGAWWWMTPTRASRRPRDPRGLGERAGPAIPGRLSI